MNEDKKPGVRTSDDAVLLRYMLDVEELTDNPVERWGLLKGMVLGTLRARNLTRQYQRIYRQNKRAAEKEAKQGGKR